MKVESSSFSLEDVLHKLKHYLPAQASLKDFVHHNTLHAFQDLPFHTGIRTAAEIFGYKVSFSLDEYRKLYQEGRINDAILNKVIGARKGEAAANEWRNKALSGIYDSNVWVESEL
jgi:hypothetical protein